MESYQKLKDISFDPGNFDEDIWFCEQDDVSYCAFSDEPIQDPVILISEYTLAHYKYYVSIICLRNLGRFYECLGNQPLKIIFRNKINDDIVKHFGLHRIPEINLDRKYYIQNNELYLDTNEVYMNKDENNYTHIDNDSSSDEEELSDNDVSSDEDEEMSDTNLEEVNI